MPSWSNFVGCFLLVFTCSTFHIGNLTKNGNVRLRQALMSKHMSESLARDGVGHGFCREFSV